ncbi:MAG: hypothetical protein KAV40_00225 [Thermoplasmatales archaeon]|nr:hypothetical protein [Thermoplasmatales archaeon]
MKTKYYIGLDVHKEKTTYVIRNKLGNILLEGEVATPYSFDTTGASNPRCAMSLMISLGIFLLESTSQTRGFIFFCAKSLTRSLQISYSSVQLKSIGFLLYNYVAKSALMKFCLKLKGT